jgi:hypothetical protein
MTVEQAGRPGRLDATPREWDHDFAEVTRARTYCTGGVVPHRTHRHDGGQSTGRQRDDAGVVPRTNRRPAADLAPVAPRGARGRRQSPAAVDVTVLATIAPVTA